MVSNLEAAYAHREYLVRALVADALGPGDAKEVISDRPAVKYITGVLYPADAVQVDPAADVDETDGYDEHSMPDPGIALSHRRYPSSMAITFSVDQTACAAIAIRADAATYSLHPGLGDEEPDTGREHWVREPIATSVVSIDVSKPGDSSHIIAAGLELFVRVRTADPLNLVSVTAALVNRRLRSAGLMDADCFFQPQLEVRSDNDSACFAARQAEARPMADEELESYQLLYRHSRSFAVGHGCSSEWEVESSADRASAIRSTFVPEYHLRVAEANQQIDIPSLSMARIVRDPRDQTLAGFRHLAAEYEHWIEGLDHASESLPQELGRPAQRHVTECRHSLARISAGIETLEDDELAWEAFRLANESMVNQRDRGRSDLDETDLDRHRWYPFQLAFMLLSLRGIADPTADDRSVADLLWFPTGGGKTEAYLGLIAFTVLLRRLRSPDNGAGVTALMRYTLRLLTLQQFERAAVLICALESMRRSRKDLGDEPISIGLWVGRDATPLTRRETRTALDKLRSAPVDKGNPVQLHSCPWCNTRLDHRNYWLPQDQSRLIVSCKNSECEFGQMGQNSLPVFLIDEDIYDYRPSLVIATADKFASLPWRDRTGQLFNVNQPEPPPELIIQDELHLISGPLGTLTGLYETVVDHLCSLAGPRPKVIASTATIRRAGQQGVGLFARAVAQFPPPGIDARDSFFAVEAPPDRRGTRSYVGLMAPGTSHTTLLVRAYALLLQASAEADVDDPVRDLYWSLVGYFNSLRVLGGARMQVRDDVGDRISLLAHDHQTEARSVASAIELTSRESSALIPQYLAQMALKYPNEDAVDVILATNMISVGVDVGRLGLMVVMGQPPSSAEYIQATSRVGRQDPGLVVVLYNAARSRDQSHYERFVDYHSSIYREVEATSVTPFAQRARDRGLHAVIVALARHLIPEFASNAGASAIVDHRQLLGPIRDEVLRRVDDVAPGEHDAVAAEIEEFLDYWQRRATEESSLVYSNFQHPEVSLLGDAATFSHGADEPVGTLWSLRDVDQTSNLYLVYS